MKTQKFLLIAALFLFIAMMLSSCFNEEDPGPIQSDTKAFSVVDFDRLEMGDAFVVTVTQSTFYSIHARGDRRNLSDLEVKKIGSTLKIQFDENGNRDHVTYIDITMPDLAGINFSGATRSTLSGFEVNQLDVVLSGASTSQMNIESVEMNANLSGASKLTLDGTTINFMSKVSGASELNAFSFLTEVADVEADGASRIKVFASKTLKAVANGASKIYYRGTATVDSSANGASTVRED